MCYNFFALIIFIGSAFFVVRVICINDAFSTLIAFHWIIIGGTKFLDKLVGDFKNIIEDMLIDCQNIQINQEIGQGKYYL